MFVAPRSGLARTPRLARRRAIVSYGGAPMMLRTDAAIATAHELVVGQGGLRDRRLNSPGEAIPARVAR